MSEMPTTARRPTRQRRPTLSPATLPHALLADADATETHQRVMELSRAGFRVSFARTGFEAIVKASCHLPDLIVIGGLADLEASETSRLLATCPVTSHIPIIQLQPGRKVPVRTLHQVRRAV